MSGAKRGSLNAAANAFCATSSFNSRCASRVPMHPRNSPHWVSVTNVAIPTGYDYVITNASSASNLFFRLKK